MPKHYSSKNFGNYQTLFICGPTGSGKSSLAIRIAQEINGTIINADSMQVFRGLEILTSCPSKNDKNIVPHKLYNFVDPNHHFSVGIWLSEAIEVAQEARNLGKVPIFVGGTGLYFRALLNGLATIPKIDDITRSDTRILFETLGREAFCAHLAELDPVGIKRINIADTQRLLRLYEVVISTGKTLQEWQNLEPNKKQNSLGKIIKLILSPERNELYDAINNRLEKMIEIGLLEELKIFLEDKVYNSSQAQKALGVKEFSDYLDGKIELCTAIASSQLRTRHFAKRQLTWFRNQMPSALWLNGFGNDVIESALNYINKCNQVDQI